MVIGPVKQPLQFSAFEIPPDVLKCRRYSQDHRPRDVVSDVRRTQKVRQFKEMILKPELTVGIRLRPPGINGRAKTRMGNQVTVKCPLVNNCPPCDIHQNCFL